MESKGARSVRETPPPPPTHTLLAWTTSWPVKKEEMRYIWVEGLADDDVGDFSLRLAFQASMYAPAARALTTRRAVPR